MSHKSADMVIYSPKGHKDDYIYTHCTHADALKYNRRYVELMSTVTILGYWDDFICPSYDIFREDGVSHLKSDEGNWDVFFSKMYVCRVSSRELAIQSLAALRHDPSLVVIFQTHES